MSRIRWGGGGDRGQEERPLVESWILITNLAKLALPRASSRARETSICSMYLVVGWLPGLLWASPTVVFSPRFAEYWLIVNCMWSLDLAPWHPGSRSALLSKRAALNNAHQHDGGEHPCWELFYLLTYTATLQPVTLTSNLGPGIPFRKRLAKPAFGFKRTSLP